MRRVINQPSSFGRTAFWADTVVVRVRASYLLGRRLQAPISTVKREPDR